ncbi:hypothetical protein V491_07953 [Pseudogymnoascus sp. VKM F-3775]|nr:hypothetical protein V491_07953 [Pseudogymnoascus sp. VKM F-3775]
MPITEDDSITAVPPKTWVRLNNPVVQNFITGLVIACSAGIYLALTGLGAGGGKPSSQYLASTSNSILYALFAVSGWVSAGFLNAFGPKITMAIGVLGYPLYAGGLWYFDASGNDWFALFGAVMNGIGAGLLFTGAGFVQFAYAEEKEKGTYIFWQHTMLSGGAIIGAIVTFAINFYRAKASVPTSVYAIFVAIMTFASLLALTFIISPKNIIRHDGTHLAKFKKTTVKEELIILPAILAALLDAQWIGIRKVRGIIGVIFTAATTISLAAAELNYFKQKVDRTKSGPSMDWSDPGYANIMILHLLWGGCFCCWTFMVQWIMGSMSNKPEVLSRYAGLFKGTSALGVCVAFAIDARKPQYWVEMSIHFALYMVAIFIMAYVVWFSITDTDYLREDGVIAPKKVVEDLVGPDGTSLDTEKSYQTEFAEEKK